MWILIRCLHQKPADLDLHCFQKKINLVSVGQWIPVTLCMLDTCACSLSSVLIIFKINFYQKMISGIRSVSDITQIRPGISSELIWVKIVCNLSLAGNE